MCFSAAGWQGEAKQGAIWPGESDQIVRSDRAKGSWGNSPFAGSPIIFSFFLKTYIYIYINMRNGNPG